MIRPWNLLYVTAGNGHRAAAQALREVLDEEETPNSMVDLLSFSNFLFSWTYSNVYDFISEHAHLAVKGIYRMTDRDRRSSRAVKLVDYISLKNVEGFEHFMGDNAQATCICTHFFPASVLSRLKSEGAFQGKFYVVITDYGLHKMWVTEGPDRYFVSSDNVARELVARGVNPERVSVTGIPVHGKFAVPVEKEKVRTEMKLDPAATTVLFVASALSETAAADLVHRLSRFGRPMNLLVVAGRNKGLLSRLEDIRETPPVNLRKFEFVNNLQEFMAISDLMITKPGGLTVSEAMSVGIPLLMFNPIPYQEIHNANYVERHGAGVLASSDRNILTHLEGLYETPERLISMRQKAKKMGRPGAAAAIVREIHSELKK